MAQFLTQEINNITEYPNSFVRQGPFPLDKYSYFSSMEAAEEYAQSSPIAYIGQPLAVFESNDNSETNAIEEGEGAVATGRIGFYLIQANNTLQEVGVRLHPFDESLVIDWSNATIQINSSWLATQINNSIHSVFEEGINTSHINVDSYISQSESLALNIQNQYIRLQSNEQNGEPGILLTQGTGVGLLSYTNNQMLCLQPGVWENNCFYPRGDRKPVMLLDATKIVTNKLLYYDTETQSLVSTPYTLNELQDWVKAYVANYIHTTITYNDNEVIVQTSADYITQEKNSRQGLTITID